MLPLPGRPQIRTYPPIRAYGSSDDGFAIQQTLYARTAILGRDGDTWFQVRSLGRSSRPRVQHQAPPFGFSFLHRVLRDQFPGFISTMRVLRLPAAHPAALRFLRLAVPRLHSLFSLLDGQVRRQGLELVTRYLRPGCCRGDDRISQVPGEPRLSVCTCSNPTPAGLLAPDHYGAAAWPLVCRKAKAPTKGLSTLNSMAFGLAVYASPGSLPPPDARLASGCWSGSTGRAFHPQDSDERFQSCSEHLIPLSQACLAQSHPPVHLRRSSQESASGRQNGLSFG